MDNFLTLNNVNKIYGTSVKTQVLFDINLSFENGSFNSIIGQSGSGKSTILNIMGTLDKPTSGEVYIRNQRTDLLKSNELAKLRNETIGFIFQFHYLLPEFTAFENVMMPYLIKNPNPSKKIYEKANELMHLVELDNVKNNKAINMSGGQQQRTAIARSLINDPPIILADEPTGNLDSDNTEKVYDILRKVNQDLKTTFIVITHDRRIAEKADRIIEIKDGRVNSNLLK